MSHLYVIRPEICSVTGWNPPAGTADTATTGSLVKHLLQSPPKAACIRFPVCVCRTAVAYVVPATVGHNFFLTPDGSLANVKIGGIAFYGLGAMAWLGFGFIGCASGTFKDKPRMQTNAMLRLFLIELLLLAVSAGTVFSSVASRPRLDIVSPARQRSHRTHRSRFHRPASKLKTQQKTCR